MSSNEISYLILGHITQDVSPSEIHLGGTASYSGLTACALGHSVRMVTAFPQKFPFPSIKNLSFYCVDSEKATKFKNIMQNGNRKQYCYSQATVLTPDVIPPEWMQSDIVHIGPVAQEILPETAALFREHHFLCATPQGWMRSWDEEGLVHPINWNWAEQVLPYLKAVVISTEDIQGDEKIIAEMVRLSNILVVTEAKDGARVYWNGDVRHFSAPNVTALDATGAGDIFSAVYFSRLFSTGDAWQSAKIAVQLASHSVSKAGLQGIPTIQDIQQSMVEIMK